MAAWNSPIYRETAMIVLSLLFVSAFIVYLLRRKNYYFIVSWASLKSWIVVAPLLFGAFGTPEPWPLVALTCIAILGAKIFFQILGMYHQSAFVLTCYAGIIGLAYSIQHQNQDLYNVMPMIVMGISCLIPLFFHAYKNMIQYIALTMLSFIFLGWSFMHLGLIMKFENGLYQMMYLLILTEFCDNTNLAISKSVGTKKFLPKLNPKRTYLSTLMAITTTLILAFLMRHLLPDGSEKYWLVSGLIASLGGVVGDLVMSVVRRDLGVRIMGAFILGRGDFLHRMDRLIFVAPIYYYIMQFLQNTLYR